MAARRAAGPLIAAADLPAERDVAVFPVLGPGRATSATASTGSCDVGDGNHLVEPVTYARAAGSSVCLMDGQGRAER